MRRLICMVLCFTVLFTITACGNSQSGQNSDGQIESSAPASSRSDTRPEETKQAEPEVISNTEAPTEVQAAESARKGTEQENVKMKMKIQVGDTSFTATLSDNSSVDALKELISDGPLTLNMSDYAGMEKGADLGVTLPQNNEQMNTQAGDIILYQGRTFVIYYDTNSWSLTPIGKIEDVNAEELKEVLGAGDVTVTIYIE